MEVRTNTGDTGHGTDLGREAFGRVLGRHVAVQRGDVPMHRHVDPWLIECVLEWSERRSNSIGEDEVVDVLVRVAAAQSVPGPVEQTRDMVDAAGDPTTAPARRTTPSTERSDQENSTPGAGHEGPGPNHAVPPFPAA